MADMMTAGTQIDLFHSSLGDMFSNLLTYGLEYDKTPQLQKFKYDLNRLEPSTIKMFKQMANGGLYALPVAMQPSPPVYNRDIFRLV